MSAEEEKLKLLAIIREELEAAKSDTCSYCPIYPAGTDRVAANDALWPAEPSWFDRLFSLMTKKARISQSCAIFFAKMIGMTLFLSSRLIPINPGLSRFFPFFPGSDNLSTTPHLPLIAWSAYFNCTDSAALDSCSNGCWLAWPRLPICAFQRPGARASKKTGHHDGRADAEQMQIKRAICRAGDSVPFMMNEARVLCLSG